MACLIGSLGSTQTSWMTHCAQFWTLHLPSKSSLQSGKYADVTHLPNVKPITVVSKNIRPTPLTPSLSKVADVFDVHAFVAPAILESVDPNHFGAIPKSSCEHALVSMLHTWAQATDRTCTAVRIVQLDYRKAFDLSDHCTLTNKVLSLHIPRGVARWIIDFLMDRSQRVKLSHNCFSEWNQYHLVYPGQQAGSFVIRSYDQWSPPLRCTNMDICRWH